MSAPPDRWVVDANVVLKLFVDEPPSKDAHAFLAPIKTESEGRFHVPDFLYTEATNVFWKYVRRGDMTLDEAIEHLRELRAMALIRARTEDLLESALRLAHQHDVSGYDAAYLALADQLGAPLVTLDQPLQGKMRGKKPTVLSLAEALARARIRSGEPPAI
jgi:predicted nucleic acid-binding protein